MSSGILIQIGVKAIQSSSIDSVFTACAEELIAGSLRDVDVFVRGSQLEHVKEVLTEAYRKEGVILIKYIINDYSLQLFFYDEASGVGGCQWDLMPGAKFKGVCYLDFDFFQNHSYKSTIGFHAEDSAKKVYKALRLVLWQKSWDAFFCLNKKELELIHFVSSPCAFLEAVSSARSCSLKLRRRLWFIRNFNFKGWLKHYYCLFNRLLFTRPGKLVLAGRNDSQSINWDHEKYGCISVIKYKHSSEDNRLLGLFDLKNISKLIYENNLVIVCQRKYPGVFGYALRRFFRKNLLK